MRSRLESATGWCGVSRPYEMGGALTVFYGIHWLDYALHTAFGDGWRPRTGHGRRIQPVPKIIPTITIPSSSCLLIFRCPPTQCTVPCMSKPRTGTRMLRSLLKYSTLLHSSSEAAMASYIRNHSRHASCCRGASCVSKCSITLHFCIICMSL